MNTRISYRYADKTNCRQYTSIVLGGTITWEQIEPYLAKHGSFIPGQLGLEDLQRRFALPGGDHPWHQIAPDDITPTEAAPTIDLMAGDLAERFGHTRWDADWLASSLPWKANIMESAVAMDGIVHTYAEVDKSLRRQALRSGTRKHALSRASTFDADAIPARKKTRQIIKTS